MMLRVTNYGSAPIEYGLERSSRRTLAISVLPDCTVRVVAPIEADLKEIDDRVRRRARWILRQQRRFAEFRPRTPARRYVGGGKPPIFGTSVPAQDRACSPKSRCSSCRPTGGRNEQSW